MKLIDDLELNGITVYLSDNGKLKYRGRQPPIGDASFLLAELKKHKDEAIAYLQANTMDVETALDQAWDGELKCTCLIAPRPEYANLWGGNVWLCPDDKAKQQIRQKYPNDFALSAGEFFMICQGIADDVNMKPMIDACRLFGGDLQNTKGSLQNG